MAHRHTSKVISFILKLSFLQSLPYLTLFFTTELSGINKTYVFCLYGYGILWQFKDIPLTFTLFLNVYNVDKDGDDVFLPVPCAFFFTGDIVLPCLWLVLLKKSMRVMGHICLFSGY
jgi:hypothetical protein